MFILSYLLYTISWNFRWLNRGILKVSLLEILTKFPHSEAFICTKQIIVGSWVHKWIWKYDFSKDFTPLQWSVPNITAPDFLNQCCWHVIRKVIWYVTKVRIFEKLCNIYLFSSSCLCTVLSVSVLYIAKKSK